MQEVTVSAAPANKAEFEEMLVAFKDNADTLLGADADKMVPFMTSYDIGWDCANIIASFIDPDITDKEFYINGKKKNYTVVSITAAEF